MDLIYMDNHATTRCDPRVVAAMLPMLETIYGNAHSTAHAAGRLAAQATADAVAQLAVQLGCGSDELVMTSGATESNNLALIGYCTHPRQKRRHVITSAIEHPSVLDPLARLEQAGYRVTRLEVRSQRDRQAGRVDLEQLASAIDEETALVSIMLANNEIGVLQDMRAIADLCRTRGAVLHTDATQAVGRVPVDVEHLGVDMLSASAHKFYGPKGVGLLYVRGRGKRVRLRPIIDGGGQQRGLRSGTLNTAGIVAMAAALKICAAEMPGEAERVGGLADRLWRRLRDGIAGVELNGPSPGGPSQSGPAREPDRDRGLATAATEGSLEQAARDGELRLPGNLNVCFPLVEGDSLMAAVPRLAVSSGAACSSMDPGPSHVLRAIGLTESAARRSLRFGLGRFNTEAEVDSAAELLIAAYDQLRGGIA